MNVKVVGGLIASVVLLTGCDGVRGASDFAKRESFFASFDQIPLVEHPTPPDRPLKMFVFTDKGVSVVRQGYEVNFSAAVYRQ